MRSSFQAAIFGFALFSIGALEAAELFPRPLELLPNIAFWTKVYRDWTTEKIAFTDEEDLRMIYKVIDVPPIGERLNGLTREQHIKKAREAIAQSLRELDLVRPQSEAEAEAAVSGLSLQIYRALKDVNRADKYQRGDFIRAQNGLSNRFEKGYALSGAHSEEIKARLKREGLPEELIAIVFVESLFFGSSRSHAGAAGIWQFMRGTAREFMQVNHLVDERYDPMIATEAAILYLKGAQEKLGSWPLAITSYNHGRTGMMRAVQKTGSRDIVDILKSYESRTFGFASRNYYAEFLAALDVYNNASRIFENTKPVTQWAYDVTELPKAVFAQDLVTNHLVDSNWLIQYNPALTPNVRFGKEVIPQGFKIRIPVGQKDAFDKRFVLLPAKSFDKAESAVRAHHRANGRQRVFEIARTYDIFHDLLAKRLGYEPNQKPKKGTVILVRSADTRFTQIPAPIFKAAGNYQIADARHENFEGVH